MTARAVVDEDTVLAFGRGVRLSFDKRRQSWVLMAPERVLVLDDIASEIVRSATATPPQSVGQAIDGLAAQFSAPRQDIAGDVMELLQSLADKRFLVI